MPVLISKIRRLLSSEDGPTAVEYALLIGFIAVTLIGMVSALSGQMTLTFSSANSAVSGS